MLRDLLDREGVEIGRRHVAALMKRMRIEALDRKPNTSKPAPGHEIHPHLSRGVAVRRPDQAWAMDITHMPMARGFVYLAAVVDWYSREALSRRPSITMDAASCIEALEEAFARHGRPEIFNTSQGFTGVLSKAGIAIRMGGTGAWRDHVFVERLWRSIEDEDIHLRADDPVGGARASVVRCLALDHGRRPRSSPDRPTPEQADLDGLPRPAAA